MAGSDQFTVIAAAVAREFLGEENKSLSTQGKELRFGNKGSVSVDVQKGTFFDHASNEGGGVLWFVEQQTGRKGKEAVEELTSRGFDIEDRGAPPPRSSGGSGGGEPPRMKPVAHWDYHDADGKVLFQVVRMEDGTTGSDGKPVKSYRQRRPDASAPDGWTWKTKGMQMVPYRLPAVLEAVRGGDVIYIVEGEKAADKLLEQGVPATTNARGAGNWQRELNEYFKGARVVVIPDNDPQAVIKKTGEPRFHEDGSPVFPGQDHARAVAGQLERIAKETKLLELPDLPLKGDVVDWLGAGNTVDALYDLADACPKFEREPFKSKFRAVTWSDMDEPGEEHEWLVKGLITRNELGMIAGPSKSGKSFLVLDMTLSIARGLPWFGKRTLRGGVIYQAGEGAKGIKKRIRAYREHHGITTASELPFVLLPSRVDLYSSDDHTEAMIDEIQHWSDSFDVPLELVVIDTFSTATAGANENDGKDVSQVLERCARISQVTGAAVLLVHHMNADGGKIRGHTSILANLENVLLVRQVPDAHDEQRRQLREVILDKNKDGESGQSFKFVLKGVTVGIDEDGDPITSCVIQQPDGARTDVEAYERPNVTDNESLMLRAIEKALSNNGSPPPASMRLPSSVSAVVEWKLIRTAYDSLAFDVADADTETDDERKKRLDTRAKAMKRSGESLMRKGIISKEGNTVWLTNRRVKGHRQVNTAQPPSSTSSPPPQDEPPPADDHSYWGPDNDDYKDF